MQIQLSVESTAHNINKLTEQLTVRTEANRNSTIKRWLYPDGIDSEGGLSALLSQKETGTGIWLLQSDAFLSWKSKCNGWMWLHGTGTQILPVY
jgi:hypothetical protein